WTEPPPYFRLLVRRVGDWLRAPFRSPLVIGRITPETGGSPPPGWSGAPGTPPGAAAAAPARTNVTRDPLAGTLPTTRTDLPTPVVGRTPPAPTQSGPPTPRPALHPAPPPRSRRPSLSVLSPNEPATASPANPSGRFAVVDAIHRRSRPSPPRSH